MFRAVRRAKARARPTARPYVRAVARDQSYPKPVRALASDPDDRHFPSPALTVNPNLIVRTLE